MFDPSSRINSGRLNRRGFLKAASAATLPFLLGGRLLGQAGQGAPSLIVRSQNPDNLEFPFAALNNVITPNNLFYVRNHFAVPQINANDWRLRVVGAVGQELTLSLADLRAMPSRTVTATLECAGNTRSLVQPPLPGVPWGYGAIGNAAWTGVPLIAVLERATMHNSTAEIVLQGADRGPVTAEPGLGEIHFARSISLVKARQQDVLLAYSMNGTDLPPSHGFPIRAVVPDWYGMASVKWLQQITVALRPFTGHFQSLDYTIFEQQSGQPQLVPITEMQPKALIAQPTAGQVLGTNAEVRIHGAAWTGDSSVARVDVSTNGGQTWQQAQLLGQAAPHSWRLWQLAWRTPAQVGPVTLMAGATDARGRQQPMERERLRRNYVVNHVIPVEVQVR